MIITEVDYCPLTGDTPAPECSFCKSRQNQVLMSTVVDPRQSVPICDVCWMRWFGGARWDAAAKQWVGPTGANS